MFNQDPRKREENQVIFKMIVAENISQLMIDFNSQIKQPKKKNPKSDK